jgi:hypothetical protein
MIAIYRCAACGSPRVKADEKCEGYSITKGIVGTAIFGNVGAVAGINGKKKTYYHCPDCGTTLSYPMGRTILNVINEYISNPSANESALRSWKKNYPNIEWVDPKALSDDVVLSVADPDQAALLELSARIPNISAMPLEQVQNIIAKKILKYHEITGCRYATEDEIQNAIGYNKYKVLNEGAFIEAFPVAEVKLQQADDIVYETIDGLSRYVFLTPEEKKERAKLKLTVQTAVALYKENESIIYHGILDILPKNIWITHSECRNIFFDYIFEKEISDDIQIVDRLFNRWRQEAIRNNDLMEQTLENGELVYSKTDEESKLSEEERKEKERINVLIEQSNKATEIASQKISDAKKLMAFMKGKLPVEKPTFTEDELTTIRFRDNLLKNAYGISEFEELLYWSVYAGLLEFDGMKFMLPGKSPAENDIYKEQKDKLDEAEKKKEPFISQLSGLKSEEQRLVVSLKEQQNIYDENASKIFGAGAKKKKDAKQKMIEIENSLRSIKSKIEEKEKAMVSIDEDIEAIQNMMPIDRFAAKRFWHHTQHKYITKVYSDTEAFLRREVVRVLQENKIPMGDGLIQEYSEQLKQYVATKPKLTESLSSIMNQMYLDKLLLKIEVPTEYFHDSYYVPISNDPDALKTGC